MNPIKSVRKIRRSKYPMLKPLPQSSQVIVKQIVDYILSKTKQIIGMQLEIQNDFKVKQIMKMINQPTFNEPLNQVKIEKCKLMFQDFEPISQPNKTIIQITSNIQNKQEQKYDKLIHISQDYNIKTIKQTIPIKIKNIEIPKQSIFIMLQDFKLKQEQESIQIDPEFRQIMLKKRQRRVNKQQQIIKQRIKGRYDRYRLNKFSLRQLDSTKPSLSSSIPHTCSRHHTHSKIESDFLIKKRVMKTQNNSPKKSSNDNSNYFKQISFHRTKNNYQQNVRMQIPCIKSFHIRSIESNKPVFQRYINKVK